MEDGEVTSVAIRPEVAMYGILRNLNYKAWYAFAEFVDNSVQSFQSNSSALQKLHRYKYRLQVDIELLPASNRIVIRDNAAGIFGKDFPRAFRPAQLPPDRQGLSEFGMGMKSAACWFANSWQVRTKALGENVERTISFDIRKIIEAKIEELEVVSRPAQVNEHYTELVLIDPHQFPVKRTVAKIKDHLSSIYRMFSRVGLLKLNFDGELLEYEEPKILVASFYKNPSSKPIAWKKDLDISLSDGRKITGFAALREKGSTTYAGFSLFRRGRLIVGSADETYRPQEVFGNSNSFNFQRLFGELKLEGFEVSHTKDGFQWGGIEEEFLNSLKKELNASPMRLLDQGQEHRVNPPRERLKETAELAVERTALAIQEFVPAVVEKQLSDRSAFSLPVPETLLESQKRSSSREIALQINGQRWEVLIETVTDSAIGDWLSYSKRESGKVPSKIRYLDLRINLSHPFVNRFIGATQENVELLVRMGVGIALALISAQDIGMGKGNAVILSNLNELLREGLSKAV